MVLEVELVVGDAKKGEDITRHMGKKRPLSAVVVKPYSKGIESTVRVTFYDKKQAFWWLREEGWSQEDAEEIISTRAIALSYW